MLVLSRRTDAGDRSTICIGNDMEITLIEVQGDEVRIGVRAPREAVVDGRALGEQMRGRPGLGELTRRRRGIRPVEGQEGGAQCIAPPFLVSRLALARAHVM